MEIMEYVAYLRVSTTRQGASGLGLDAQREIIRNYLQGKEPISEFVEIESGRKSDRPKLQEALALCRKEKATLIVAKLDRLSRNVAFTSRLLESDVEIKFCDFPEANRLVLHIISSIAEYEANMIRARTKQALDAKKARGEPLGKPENFTDNQNKAILHSRETIKAKASANPNNKRAIAMLKILVGQTSNLSEMARILNNEGFTTSRGGTFTAQQVKLLLERYNIQYK
ncbi:MAG: recombinase family protein [Prevotellaceae bacterium]|nr:recombinase family protein [Candidatus Colivivens equi]